ncbi:MAG: PAS domain-containing protein [Desulfovibrio sp.]|jgi:signal transduction histidine kinase/PAS domain-containing protein|nr:PAS domain-containing protein [Desulfovibrio sp.]
MASQERRVQHELLVALYEARKRVSALEAALAHQEAMRGEGVEREGMPGAGAPAFADSSDSLMQYIGLIEPGEDISDFIGREGHDASRPRLGPDVSLDILPDAVPSLHPMVSRLVDGHPDDMLSINFGSVGADSAGQAALSPDQAQYPAGGESLRAAGLVENIPMPEDGVGRYGCGPSPDALPRTSPGAAAPPAASGFVPDGTWQDFPLPASPLPQEEGVGPDGEASPFSEESRRDGDCLRSCPVLQLCHEGVWDWDLPSGALYTSSRWREIIGAQTRRRGESPFETFVRHVHPSDRAALHARFDSLLSGVAKMLSLELRFRRGESVWGWGVLLAVGIAAGGKVRRIIAVLRDITEQRKTEIALQAEGEFFRALTGGDSPDVVGCFDRQGRILSISPNFSRYSAALPEQLLGKHLQDIDISGEVAFFEENLRQVFEVGIPFQEEIRLLSSLTGEFIADCRFQPEFSGDGNVSSVTVVLRDMTSSRRMKDNYHALLNAMEDGFVLLEHDAGRRDESSAYGAGTFSLVSINASFSRMFFVKAAKVVGKRLDEVIGEDARAWAECLRLALTENKPVKGLVSVAAQRFALIAYSPEKGRVACLVTREVAEALRTAGQDKERPDKPFFAVTHTFLRMDEFSEEEAARFTIEQAKSLAGSRLAYLYITGEGEGERGTLYWSREDGECVSSGDFPPLVRDVSLFRKTERLSPDMAELVNAADGRAADIFGGECPVARYMLATALDEGNIVCVAAVADKDGEYDTAELRQLIPLVNDLWLCVRRRRRTLALRRAKDEAEAADRAKTELLNAFGHSLRTPLNSILGMLQALQQSPLSETQQEWMLTANYSGLGLLRGISDLLDFSRIEADAIEFSPHLFDFPSTVRSAVAMFAHQAGRKKIGFKLNMDAGIPGALIGDDARVRQILVNMVDNAFKFTARGGIRIECALLPRKKNGSVLIFIEVRDTGSGMPREALEDLSRAFAGKGDAPPYTGTGIGLAVACKMASLMGGSLGVESVVGRGTIVHCSLPFDEPRQAASESPELFAAETHASRSLDVLVAGEDPSDQCALRAMLHQAGHTSVCVGNGRQALEALMLRSFDCVITDIRMPVMDGEELVRRLRAGDTAGIRPGSNVCALLGTDAPAGSDAFAVTEDIPVVALTPQSMAAERERVLALGMDYCLAMPVFAAELSAVLGHIGTLLRARGEQ